MTNKSKTLAIRLNPEKIVDKQILDFLDNPYISKSKLVKTALIHEIANISKAKNEPYLNSTNEENANTDNSNVQVPTSNKERLGSGFKAFSDKDF
ncbi:dihydrodipicolinate reductase [Lactobacillus sp. ESL0679]|uniref:dihydrodipicolinate reductase n=1 Tax=Lactobacillus sp. ESL0679 TaxID=2983209 RepID=UPI0023F91E3E|nr:dihydrodipicolinate reductase [Lactobacillus sp. ESL0679]MDF7683784.1 dihydrodipicolinate reductase [Lactobacillus sp. ESL0679]